MITARWFLLSPLIFLSPCANAEELTFELYSRNGAERSLLASDTKTYLPSDFVTRSEERRGRFYGTRKELELYDGYSVGILDNLDNKEGFGLAVSHLPFGSRPNEFSWEWFKPAANGEFVKLQGGNRIVVELAKGPAASEVRSIRFLEDSTFKYTEDRCCKRKDDEATHILIIKAGSVLAFPADGS